MSSIEDFGSALTDVAKDIRASYEWERRQRVCPDCEGTGLVPDNEHYTEKWGAVITDPYYTFLGKRYCRTCRERRQG